MSNKHLKRIQSRTLNHYRFHNCGPPVPSAQEMAPSYSNWKLKHHLWLLPLLHTSYPVLLWSCGSSISCPLFSISRSTRPPGPLLSSGTSTFSSQASKLHASLHTRHHPASRVVLFQTNLNIPHGSVKWTDALPSFLNSKSLSKPARSCMNDPVFLSTPFCYILCSLLAPRGLLSILKWNPPLNPDSSLPHNLCTGSWSACKLFTALFFHLHMAGSTSFFSSLLKCHL